MHAVRGRSIIIMIIIMNKFGAVRFFLDAGRQVVASFFSCFLDECGINGEGKIYFTNNYQSLLHSSANNDRGYLRN